MKIKIGLIGEDPNDTLSIQNLLLQKYPNAFHFKQLIKNKRGYQLDNVRANAALKLEFEDFNPNYVIFIRDADALPSEKGKIKKVQDWFNRLNSVVNNKGILLMNIYELEALILADIETFNTLYGTSIQFAKNCMHQKEPKEFLFQKTYKNRKVYSESHCPELFKKLKINSIIQNCSYFKEFDTLFQSKLNTKQL
jgi:hypothetical protein